MVRSLLRRLPLAALMLGAACSDSTSPRGPDDTLRTARHLDSLFSQSCTNFNNATRCQVLYLALHAAALGASPTPVILTTQSGQETWTGYVVETGIHPFSAPFWDSTFDMVFYRDPKVTTAMYVTFAPNSQAQATLVENAATTTVTAGTGTIALSQLGIPCESAPSLPQGTSWWGVCALATFNASLSVAFDLPVGIDPALATISLGPQSMNGIRDVPAGTPSGSVVRNH
jgi:hypothetical protein